MSENRIFRFFLRVILVLAAILYGVVLLSWHVVKYPFKLLKKVFKKRDLDRFLKENANAKFLFYTSSNYKMVEQYLLPLLDKSFTIHFIPQGDIDAWDGSPYLKEILEEGNLQGGYPYFIKLKGYSFEYLSLRQELTKLKKGKISSTYVESIIYFFFKEENSYF
jgi:hypothetical protein